MKMLYIVLSLVLILLIIQGVFSLTTARTETQKYKVLFKDNKFEIRQYAPAVLASVKMKYTGYSENSSAGFRILAGYIFGNNSDQRKIAMTSPVAMKMGSDGMTMSFVMPSEYDLEELPYPGNKNILMHETPGQLTATLRFGGYANDNIIKEKIEELKKILKEKSIEYTGDFTYLGYNPPYQMINRRNEIMVNIVSYPE